ncbi:MAG TPA: GNAT family N-acetyltransferase [Acetobacteraceae bacterium]|nr:GNAT family N-acetyltransferase [Acetobacteraceae bacterium]
MAKGSTLTAPPPSFTLEPVADLAAVEPVWRALEANASPFLTWSVVAAVAARFPAPHLFVARLAGEIVALALLNRTPHRLHLHEVGDPEQDGIFIEHNGFLIRPDASHLLVPALRWLAAISPLVLPGVGDSQLRAASRAGIVTRRQDRLAPAVELGQLTGAFIDGLTANARAQLRRAMRLYGTTLAIQRATDLRTAERYFAELAALHRTTWQKRGQQGAFATPSASDFHAKLIAAAHPRGELDLLRVTAADRTIGLLYCLRHEGHVCCYQTGLSAPRTAQEKPGLVCHALAIELYRAEGARLYDLLAGASRYKATLARNGGEMLHWFTLHPRLALGARGRRLAEAVIARLRTRSMFRLR